METEPLKSSAVSVRSNEGFVGVFAEQAYREGDRLLALEGTVRGHPTKYSLQIGVERHLEPELSKNGTEREVPWRFLNHSCEPNLRIDLESNCLVANRSIAVGEELTFNYLTTEWEMASPFECICDAPSCFGTIRGFKYLSPEERERLWPLAADHIKRLHRME